MQPVACASDASCGRAGIENAGRALEGTACERGSSTARTGRQAVAPNIKLAICQPTKKTTSDSGHRFANAAAERLRASCAHSSAHEPVQEDHTALNYPGTSWCAIFLARRHNPLAQEISKSKTENLKNASISVPVFGTNSGSRFGHQHLLDLSSF